MTREYVNNCFICGKEIQRGSIPRIEPELDKIKTEDKKEHLVCDACGNMLTIVFKTIKML
jgi:DNA-directed RNA polymerase subunit RPC12/RpoP